MADLRYKTNPIPGRCHALRCQRKTNGRRLCSTHRSQLSRERDPERYAFNNLRNNARRRGLIFTITLEQFRQWCRKVTYIGFKGRKADSFTIDRKHNDLGYHIDNIQVITNSENIKKYFSYDWRHKQVSVVEIKQQSRGENPF